MLMVDHFRYYNLATDFYEYGWGTSFHFCRFAAGESFSRAIARHEHYLALKLGLQEKQRVLDVGCGVGGPAREMIKFANVHVTGLNNNDYQLERATNYARKEGLGARFTAVKGDFMQMSFPENTFDAVYSIEATVHAPDLQGVYEQIFRVLKPGGKFAVLEWLMTDRYDNQNPDHRACRLGIEQGDGISNMVTVSEGLAAFQAAGFELLENIDLADRRSMSSSSSSNDHNDDAEDNEDNEDKDFNPDRAPWYWPLAGDFRYLGSLGDIFAIARMTWWGRNLMHRFMGLGEKVGLMPQGTQKTGDSMALAADCLVKGGKEKLFTPMYLMVGRKPSNP